ncbi:hypothetical protein SteCoe_8306 [Stentor coeruleus]|uniref:Uncharacterized protein n=1 Tax=Stentor coeruleus TaxID=5963 RepID=A0A1R2CKN9_9CILI|nr:hypothetical protein SteCoe_8306 [Stentor coeruleus]
MTEIMSGKLNQTLPQIASVKSLNKVARKQKLIKITMENIEMIKRIKQQKSSYNVKHWEKERKKEMNYLQNICEYPYKLKDLKGHSKNSSNHNARLSFALPYLRKSLSEEHIVFKNVFTLDDQKYLVDIHNTAKKYTLKFKHVNGENNFSAMISKKAAMKIMENNESYNILIEKAYAEKMLADAKAG